MNSPHPRFLHQLHDAVARGAHMLRTIRSSNHGPLLFREEEINFTPSITHGGKGQKRKPSRFCHNLFSALFGQLTHNVDPIDVVPDYQTPPVEYEDDLHARYKDNPDQLTRDIKALENLDDPTDEQIDILDELVSYQHMWHPDDPKDPLWVDAGADEGRATCTVCEGTGKAWDAGAFTESYCDACGGLGHVDDAPYSRNPRFHGDLAMDLARMLGADAAECAGTPDDNPPERDCWPAGLPAHPHPDERCAPDGMYCGAQAIFIAEVA